MWSALKSLRRDQRGVSAIISGLIMMSAVFGLTTFVLAHKARQGQRRAEGLMDAMRQAEKRQSQLIDFSYANENGKGGALYAYASNYGWENATIVRVWTGGETESWRSWYIEYLVEEGWISKQKTTDSGDQGYVMPNRKYARIVVENLPSSDSYTLAILTESDSIYKWKVNP